MNQRKGQLSGLIFSLVFLKRAINRSLLNCLKIISDLKAKRILVAEDNKINFFVANKFLIGWGITVTHAENGQIALDILEKEDFDLILMDLHMPVHGWN